MNYEHRRPRRQLWWGTVARAVYLDWRTCYIGLLTIIFKLISQPNKVIIANSIWLCIVLL